MIKQAADIIQTPVLLLPGKVEAGKKKEVKKGGSTDTEAAGDRYVPDYDKYLQGLSDLAQGEKPRRMKRLGIAMAAGAAVCAASGLATGVLGGILGGVIGLVGGGALGFSAGKTLAEKKAKSVKGIIGYILGGTVAGALTGAVAGAMAGASSIPIIGAGAGLYIGKKAGKFIHMQKERIAWNTLKAKYFPQLEIKDPPKGNVE